MMCIHYREKALFNLASPSEQDTVHCHHHWPGAGSGEHDGGRSDQRSFLVVVVETEPSVVIVIRVKCERR